MDKERVLNILREHEPELKAAGLLRRETLKSIVRAAGYTD